MLNRGKCTCPKVDISYISSATILIHLNDTMAAPIYSHRIECLNTLDPNFPPILNTIHLDQPILAGTPLNIINLRQAKIAATTLRAIYGEVSKMCCHFNIPLIIITEGGDPLVSSPMADQAEFRVFAITEARMCPSSPSKISINSFPKTQEQHIPQ